MPGREVGNGRRYEKRGDPSRSARHQLAVFALNHLECANSASDVNADLFGVFGRHIQPRMGDGLLSRRNAKLNEPAHLLDVFAINEHLGSEAYDLASDLGRVLCAIEQSDRPDPGFSSQQSSPYLLCAQPNRADQSL